MMGFARVCKLCGANCDPGELRNGICFECFLEQKRKKEVRQEADRMVRTDSFEQMEMEDFLR